MENNSRSSTSTSSSLIIKKDQKPRCLKNESLFRELEKALYRLQNTIKEFKHNGSSSSSSTILLSNYDREQNSLLTAINTLLRYPLEINDEGMLQYLQGFEHPAVHTIFNKWYNKQATSNQYTTISSTSTTTAVTSTSVNQHNKTTTKASTSKSKSPLRNQNLNVKSAADVIEILDSDDEEEPKPVIQHEKEEEIKTKEEVHEEEAESAYSKLEITVVSFGLMTFIVLLAIAMQQYISKMK